MVWRSFLFAAFSFASLLREASAEEANPLAGLTIAGPSVVMFWAAWCAPCRAEVAVWPELQRAAGPLPIHIVALDTSMERTRVLLKRIPADRVHFGQTSSYSMLSAWPSLATGLPFALTLNARSQICANQNGGLTVERLAAMLHRCSLHSSTAPSGRPK